LRVTGGKGPSDATFLKKMQNRINVWGFSDAVDYVADYSDRSRKQFLQSVSVMVLPARHPLAYGLSVMEACAAGRPFVVPDTGVFSELAEKTRAGVLYHPNNPVRLAETLRSLLTDPKTLYQLGRNGRQAVETVYSIDKAAADLAEMFTSLGSSHAVKEQSNA